MGVTVNEDSMVVSRPNQDPFDIDPECRIRASKELHEEPELARQNLSLLRQKLEDEEELNSRLDDVFCMVFLRARKHNVDGAFKLIKSYYDMKKKYPDFYRYCYPSERANIYDMCFFNLLPGEDRLGRKIAVLCIRNCDFSQMRIEDMYQVGTSSIEIALMDPKMQVYGGVCIMDLKDMTVHQQAKLVSPSAARQILNCVQEKIPLRIKAIHVVYQPFYFDALYAIFRPFLKSKLRKRVRQNSTSKGCILSEAILGSKATKEHFSRLNMSYINLHGSNMESLHEHIDPSVLPEEYGGTRGPMNSKPLFNLVKENEFRFREWEKHGIKK